MRDTISYFNQTLINEINNYFKLDNTTTNIVRLYSKSITPELTYNKSLEYGNFNIYCTEETPNITIISIVLKSDTLRIEKAEAFYPLRAISEIDLSNLYLGTISSHDLSSLLQFLNINGALEPTKLIIRNNEINLSPYVNFKCKQIDFENTIIHCREIKDLFMTTVTEKINLENAKIITSQDKIIAPLFDSCLGLKEVNLGNLTKATNLEASYLFGYNSNSYKSQVNIQSTGKIQSNKAKPTTIIATEAESELLSIDCNIEIIGLF